MVIEWLTFAVNQADREAFIQADTDIWTTALQAYPGFLAKEVWIQPDQPDRVTFVIRWATREQWHAVPQADLQRVDQAFQAAVDFPFELVESSEYQVRRHPTP